MGIRIRYKANNKEFGALMMSDQTQDLADQAANFGVLAAKAYAKGVRPPLPAEYVESIKAETGPARGPRWQPPSDLEDRLELPVDRVRLRPEARSSPGRQLAGLPYPRSCGCSRGQPAAGRRRAHLMLLPDRILPVYRDEELVVLEQIQAYFFSKGRTVYTGDQVPDDNLESQLPFIRVGRTGGAPIQGAEHTDRPVVDVDVLAETRAEAKQIAKEIEQLLLSRPHPIDKANVLMSPQRVPWVEGIPIRRFYASYHLSLRR